MKLHDFKILEFNHQCDKNMFNNVSEIQAALHDIINPHDYNRYENSENESVDGLNPKTRKERQAGWDQRKEGW